MEQIADTALESGSSDKIFLMVFKHPTPARHKGCSYNCISRDAQASAEASMQRTPGQRMGEGLRSLTRVEDRHKKEDLGGFFFSSLELKADIALSCSSLGG